MSTRRLLLVDGTQLFYRSFFAIKGLSTHDGTPTNAVFGFVRGIHQLIEGRLPSHLVVTWDGGIPDARRALLPEYKAQRPPMPDALRAQYAPVVEFLERSGIPLIRIEKEEADDILASLIRWGEPEADEIMVVTCDKDLYQVVSEKTKMVSWGKDDKPAGRVEVFEKTGVYPEQIVDWLSLTGDSADNISGIEGMGPKTAAKLLAQFGSLDGIWQHIENVYPQRIRERLIAGRERVARNLSLVRLNAGMNCSPGWDDLAVRSENHARMRPFYARMEFYSLIKECDQGELF
ncbi:MAG: 5'-3' exonuclease H3TH domain-containing protein [bacterium]